jgi:hypothetical protein
MATRLRDCSEATTKGRLSKAEQFLEQAAAIRDLADDEDKVGDSFVSLCVLAGIAASDVLCRRALGHFVQGEDHQQAVSELSKVRPGGKQLSADLSVLLQMKSRAGYGALAVRADDRKRAWRKAGSLVDAARSR